MALEREKQTYRSKLAELDQHHGKYVLIHGDDLIDVFESYQDALRQGYRQFGVNEPFLVQLIQGTETVQCITRMLDPTTRGALHP